MPSCCHTCLHTWLLHASSTDAQVGAENLRLPPHPTPRLAQHDDAVTSTTAATMHEIVDGKATPDGCPVVATMFVDIVANQCDKTMDLYNAGFEIADHTLHHIDVRLG